MNRATIDHDVTSVKLRRATLADIRQLWEWANDVEVRRFSFASAPIPWGDHVQWLERQLANAQTFFWIACDGAGTPIGQIRFEGDAKGEAVVSLSVAREKRGRGYGPTILQLGVQRLFLDPHWRAIIAWIKPDNAASQRSFARAGFRLLGEGEVGGHRAVSYRLQRLA